MDLRPPTTSLRASPPLSPSSKTFLTTPIQYLKGVGPYKAELLEKLGLKTVEDLLYFFPRTHQDRRPVPIREARLGSKQAFVGTVQWSEFRQVGRMLGQLRATIKDATGVLTLVWFKRLSFKYDVFATAKRDVVEGKKLLVYGNVAANNSVVEVTVEDYEALGADDSAVNGEYLVPVYPLTEGVHEKFLRMLMSRVVPAHAGRLVDPIPASIRKLHKLMPLPDAVRQYHFPTSLMERDRARERLAFDEFFYLETVLALARQAREQHARGHSFVLQKKLLSPFRRGLGYEFTRSQTKVINEIFRDMMDPKPMHRLLQGDVGSGKTVVALSAALLAIENKRQVAFLAPTEILAAQHHLSIERFFASLPVRSAILTGSTPAAQRKKILKELAEGKIDFLVGTHAILSEHVRFASLGLVVIDEQHRFGVRQRARLFNKGEEVGFANAESFQPDVLIMTATPIPRTLALTLYGDLDVSVIDEMPRGRQAVSTFCASEEAGYGHIERAVAEGRQAYVVFALVDESDLMSKRLVRAATKEYERLVERFPATKIGLLHGQLPTAEKNNVMEQFRAGKLSIMVATPVIEVGIDVGNATVIAIANPERFGLAQLHQLRGRVGRAGYPGQCILMVPDGSEKSERLEIFCSTSNGFVLAEEDLRLRGPGELVGEAQHGIPLFRVGDLIKDSLLIAQARQAALELVRGDVALTMAEHTQLSQALEKKFGRKLSLSKVG